MCFSIPEQKDKSLFIRCSSLPRSIKIIKIQAVSSISGSTGLAWQALEKVPSDPKFSTAQGAFRVLCESLGPFRGGQSDETSLKEDVYV